MFREGLKRDHRCEQTGLKRGIEQAVDMVGEQLRSSGGGAPPG